MLDDTNITISRDLELGGGAHVHAVSGSGGGERPQTPGVLRVEPGHIDQGLELRERVEGEVAHDGDTRYTHSPTLQSQHLDK